MAIEEPPKPRRCGQRSGFGFPKISSSLTNETDCGRVSVDMSGTSENSDLKFVVIVALIIGSIVLVFGLIGVALTLA